MTLKAFYHEHMLTLIDKAILSYQLHEMVKLGENIFSIRAIKSFFYKAAHNFTSGIIPPYETFLHAILTTTLYLYKDPYTNRLH